MTYRHVTNLFTPYDPIDLRFLETLADYKVGEPVPPKAVPDASWTPRTVEQMRADGVVGIYTTLARLKDGKVRGLTGWQRPQQLLGPEWSPVG